ncbi:hypothetical protein O7605_10975 [Verrucosispora sp. WMMA2121]|uniref:hypothetical protein n=1 Tax=Verrucosispora sp. WMMA2121 TaxID=3015164 RepID=UPI0022B5E87E|nr:hypothetical protein [Verrucosispora sp. WMMA2121]MCZ7420041.1 hypothetical protein [Verrucosispora sp. WMMA2121]
MSDHYGGAWTLHRRDDGGVLAELVVTGGDFPWLNARVDPREGLAELRPLFAEELRLLDGIDEDVESWEHAYETVRNAVTLRYPDGQEVPEFLLHLDGDEAWWRWSDEPFDEQNV